MAWSQAIRRCSEPLWICRTRGRPSQAFWQFRVLVYTSRINLVLGEIFCFCEVGPLEVGLGVMPPFVEESHGTLDTKQLLRSSRRNASPVELIDGPFLMCHEYLTGALAERREIAKTLSRSVAQWCFYDTHMQEPIVNKALL